MVDGMGQYDTSANLETRISLHRKFSDSEVDWFDWVADHLALRVDDRVLEVGAGTGLLWNAVAIEPELRVLSDVSAGMVERLPGIRLQADVEQLPFPDDCFTVVIANHMLYHVADIARGVDEMARVLRPGGRLIATTVGERHMAELDDLVGRRTTWSFTLQSGAEQLASRFAVERFDFADDLRITEPQPAIDYLASYMPGEDWKKHAIGVLERKIAESGAFRVTKSVGLFRATPTT